MEMRNDAKGDGDRMGKPAKEVYLLSYIGKLRLLKVDPKGTRRRESDELQLKNSWGEC